MPPPAAKALGPAAGGTGAVTVEWPAHDVNDVALLIVESANQAITLSTPAGFVQVTNSPQGTGTAGGTAATRLTVFWCRATSSAMENPVVADPGNHALGVILTFSGVKTTGDPWNITSGDVATSATTTVSIPGATTTVNDCLVVLLVSNGTDSNQPQTSGWPGGITEIVDGNTNFGNGGGFGIAVAPLAIAGTYGAQSATLANASVQGRMSIALEPAPAAYTLTAESGSYGLTGTAVGLLVGYAMAAASGSYAVSGDDASLLKGSAISAEAGSYALTGSDATLTYTPTTGYLLTADSGTYAVTGTDVGLRLDRVLPVDAGSYAITGTAADLRKTNLLSAESGSYSLTGTAVDLEIGYYLAAGAGSYSLTGSEAGLVYEPSTGYVIAAESGSYGITGTAADLEVGYYLAANAGSYVLTGSDATLSFTSGLFLALERDVRTVALQRTHTGTGSTGRVHGTSITDDYTGDNAVLTGDTTLIDGSMAPGMGA